MLLLGLSNHLWSCHMLLILLFQNTLLTTDIVKFEDLDGGQLLKDSNIKLMVSNHNHAALNIYYLHRGNFGHGAISAV